RRRLEDDLVLVVVLEAERVLAVAAVARADHGLDVRRPPRLRAETAQEGGRIHRPGAELGVVRLHQDALALGPVGLERADPALVVEAAHQAANPTVAPSGAQKACRSRIAARARVSRACAGAISS